MIKIVSSSPIWLPIWKLKFPKADFENVLFVWGGTIYSKYPVPAHLQIHEETHIKQQRHSKIFGIYWLIRYVFSPKFRLQQEIEAYKNQYRFVKNYLSISKEEKHRMLMRFSGYLSSELYGNLISIDKAIEKIK